MHHLAPGPQVPAPGSSVGPVAPSKGPVSTPAPGVVAPSAMPAAPSMEGYRSGAPDMFRPVINRLMDVPNLTPEQGQQCIESVSPSLCVICAHASSAVDSAHYKFCLFCAGRGRYQVCLSAISGLEGGAHIFVSAGANMLRLLHLTCDTIKIDCSETPCGRPSQALCSLWSLFSSNSLCCRSWKFCPCCQTLFTRR